MKAATTVLLALALMMCLAGTASAGRQLRGSPPGPPPPAQQQQQQHMPAPPVTYPATCNPTISVSLRADEPESAKWSDAPYIAGTVQITNTNDKPLPVASVVIQGHHDGKQRYAAIASCTSGAPTGTVPCCGKTLLCRFTMPLDRSVFGAYGTDAYITSAGGVVYLPHPSARPTFHLQAAVNFQVPVPQCTSSKVTVATESWWQWLSQVHSSKHPGVQILVAPVPMMPLQPVIVLGGRKLRVAATPAPAGSGNATAVQPQQQPEASKKHRLLLSSSNSTGSTNSTGPAKHPDAPMVQKQVVEQPAAKQPQQQSQQQPQAAKQQEQWQWRSEPLLSPEEIKRLEQGYRNHHSFYDELCGEHGEKCSGGRKL